MAGSVCPATSSRRMSSSRGVNDMLWVLVGGSNGASVSAIACAGVSAPASGPRGRERFFAESGAGGSHGVLQRRLVFPHSIAQPEPIALRPGRAQQPGGAFRLPGGGHDPHGLDHLGDQARSGMVPAQFQCLSKQRQRPRSSRPGRAPDCRGPPAPG